MDFFLLWNSNQNEFRTEKKFQMVVKKWSNTVSLVFALEKKSLAMTVLSKIVWNNFLSNIPCMHDIIIATTAVISHTFH